MLTDKRIYVNSSSNRNKCIAIKDITSVYNNRGGGLTDVYVATGNSHCRLSYRSSAEEGTFCTNFLDELLQYLKLENFDIPPSFTSESENKTAVQLSESSPKEEWVCQCGHRNRGKFCQNCGKAWNTFVASWTCSCGRINKEISAVSVEVKNPIKSGTYKSLVFLCSHRR